MGWGGLSLAGLLPLVPAFFLLKLTYGADSTSDPLGVWKWVVIGMAACCAVGVFVLPLEPTEARMQRQARRDMESVDDAVERVKSSMERAAAGAVSAVSGDRGGFTAGQSLEHYWPGIRKDLWDDAAAVGLYTGEDGSYDWVGSPHLAAAGVVVAASSVTAPPTGDGPLFMVAGDRLAAVAHLVVPVEQDRLVVSVLLARGGAVPGPSPQAVPVLERILPARIVDRLEIEADRESPEGTVRLSVGERASGAIQYPFRGFAQLILLVAVLITSLGMLARDDSAIRGLIAAPLIYASAVPVLLGASGYPLSPELVTPSWAGYQLINQAFIAVAAAGLALWYAVQIRRRLTGYLSRRNGGYLAFLMLVGIVLLWMLCFELPAFTVVSFSTIIHSGHLPRIPCPLLKMPQRYLVRCSIYIIP